MKTRVLVATFVAMACISGAPAQVPDLNIPDAPVINAAAETTGPRGTVAITFVGNTAFPADALLAGISQQTRSIESYGLDEASAYDAGFFVEVFYRNHGYSQVEVTTEITGPWSLRANIREGPLTRLGAITITGNSARNFSELSGYLLGPTWERFPRVRRQEELPFVEADIETGVGLIRRLYAAEGFLDAVIDEPEITFNADFSSASVTLAISEGTQVRFGRIAFEGNTAFAEADLLAAITRETNEPFTRGRLAAAGRAVEDYFRTRGYFQAVVTTEDTLTEPVPAEVDVTFHIEQGALYRFDGVAVSGTLDVPPEFIEKRLQSLSGQVYDPRLIDRKFRELIGTGLFRSLQINPEPIAGDELRLNVEVEEAKMKEFGIGVGYGTFLGGIFTVSYTDRNLFRSGRPLTTSAEITQRGYGGEVVYSDPWLFDSDVAFRVRLYAETITLEGYSKNELGVRPSLERSLTEHWKVSAFALAKTVQTNDILIEPESLVGETQYSVVSFGLSETIDYRNDPVLPTRGFVSTVAVDFAPREASDISFVRGVAQLAVFVPVIGDTVLALGARGGVISPLNADALPIDERFFNGGANSVRSYPELKLGPKDTAGYPLGGEAFTVFNAELRFPIWRELKGAVFADAGNVVADAADFGLSDMQYAIGGGLRYNLPIGPIRFDYGFNPDKQTGEPEGAFHFSIGLAF